MCAKIGLKLLNFSPINVYTRKDWFSSIFLSIFGKNFLSKILEIAFKICKNIVSTGCKVAFFLEKAEHLTLGLLCPALDIKACRLKWTLAVVPKAPNSALLKKNQRKFSATSGKFRISPVIFKSRGKRVLSGAFFLWLDMEFARWLPWSQLKNQLGLLVGLKSIAFVVWGVLVDFFLVIAYFSPTHLFYLWQPRTTASRQKQNPKNSRGSVHEILVKCSGHNEFTDCVCVRRRGNAQRTGLALQQLWAPNGFKRGSLNPHGSTFSIFILSTFDPETYCLNFYRLRGSKGWRLSNS